jgi:hypothetical protein
MVSVQQLCSVLVAQQLQTDPAEPHTDLPSSSFYETLCLARAAVFLHFFGTSGVATPSPPPPPSPRVMSWAACIGEDVWAVFPDFFSYLLLCRLVTGAVEASNVTRSLFNPKKHAPPYL